MANKDHDGRNVATTETPAQPDRRQALKNLGLGAAAAAAAAVGVTAASRDAEAEQCPVADAMVLACTADEARTVVPPPRYQVVSVRVATAELQPTNIGSTLCGGTSTCLALVAV